MTFTWGRDYRGELDPAVRERASRDWPGVGGLEAWIAGRRWRAVPGGRLVTGELHGWQFRVDDVAGGLRVSANAPGGGDPAIWVVTR
jgi:hypothetical protein